MFYHSSDGEPSPHVNRLSTHALDPYEKAAIVRFTDAACWRKIIHRTRPFQPHQACFSWKDWETIKTSVKLGLGLEYNIPGRRGEECGTRNNSPEPSVCTGRTSSLAGLPLFLHGPRVKAVGDGIFSQSSQSTAARNVLRVMQSGFQNLKQNLRF